MAKNKDITIQTPFGKLTGHHTKLRAIERYYQNPQICKSCGAIIPIKEGQRVSQVRNKIFCSNKCAASYNNSTRITKRDHPKTMICVYCGKEIEYKGYDKKYCNNTCRKNHYREHKIKTDIDHCDDRLLKAYLLQIRAYKCEVCGLDTWMGKPIPLELEHTDGNADNKDLHNLKLLCPNCHAQTPTYKGKNTGNGRHKRRMIYREGKSY